jgi:hypothetical protein
MIQPDPNLVCVWPLRTPPTADDLERIAFFAGLVQRQLTEIEVLALMEPASRA